MEFYKLYFCIALLFLMYTYKYCNDRKYSYDFAKKTLSFFPEKRYNV